MIRLPAHFLRVLGPALLGLSAVLTGVWLGAWTQPLELALYDAMLRARPATQADPRILIVGIEEADIRALGWPVPNTAIAEAVDVLLGHDAASIGIDLYKDADPETVSPVWRAVLDHPQVNFIREIGSQGGESIPGPPGVPAARVAASDLVTDPDGIVRRLLLYLQDDTGAVQPTLPMLMALRRLESQGLVPQAVADDPRAFELGRARFAPLTGVGGGYRHIDAGGFQIMLNYRPTDSIADRVSLGDLLAGRVAGERIAGRLILLGTLARSIKDTHLTPYADRGNAMQAMPGVEIHAHAISQILDLASDAELEPATGYPLMIRTLPTWIEALWILAWVLAGAGLVWRVSNPYGLAVAFMLGLPVIVGVGTALLWHGWWLPTATPVLGFVLAFALLTTLYWAFRFNTDATTGLPNRRRLMAGLKHSRLHNRLSSSLISIHPDQIDTIRAVYGEQSAEQAMKGAAETLHAACRQAGLRPGLSGPLYRTGEAAFAILLDDDPGAERALALAQDCRLQATFETGHGSVYLGSCIGVAAGDDLGGANLLDAAESAAYQAQALHTSDVRRFMASTRETQRERLSIEHDLRAMLDTEDEARLRACFPVFYQPLIDLQKNRLIGFEALIRWQHPQRGLVSPGLFIPIAEGTELIVTLGHWILREACRQTVDWQTRIPGCESLCISVNVAARQLAAGKLLCSQVDAVLRDTGLAPEHLKLEITESGIIGDFETALEILDRLHDQGIQISLDDFGTGYSSLSYLIRIPANNIKVDQSFVRTMDKSPHNRSLIESIISLAKRLDLAVITEGIETSEQCQIIRDLGSDIGQGFLFSKPLPVEQAESLLLESSQHPVIQHPNVIADFAVAAAVSTP